MRDYHDHYLLSDVLLLADVFENFRNSIYEQHRLDPLHFITLPLLAWASALKYTNARLDLITDPDMYLMVENSMRGGIATILHRHARANNPLVEGYDPSKPPSGCRTQTVIICMGGMIQPLPVGNFRFLSPDEIVQVIDLMSVPSHGDTGYIVECDLQYPQNFMTSIATTPWRRNISPSRQICLAISVTRLKLKIGNPCKNSFPTFWIKPIMSGTIVTYNFMSNTVSF